MIRSVPCALLFAIVLGGNAVAQTCSGLTTLTNGTNADATQVMGNFNTLLNCINAGTPRAYVSGLTLSTSGSSSSFGISQGVATSDDASTSMKLATAYSKTTAAWAVGSGNGALDTGSIANNSWYHVFLVERTDTGVVDVLVSLSSTTPVLPASYTKQRRIGSMKTNGSGQWIFFHQLGDEFLWDAVVSDASGVDPGSTGNLIALSVPSGVQVYARASVIFFRVSSGGTYLQVTSPDVANNSTTSGNATLFSVDGTHPGSTEITTRTNTASQVRFRSDIAGDSMYVNTMGWVDHRGRDN